MKTIQTTFALILMLVFSINAQDAYSKNAQSILAKADAVINAPNDMHQFSKMILIEKGKRDTFPMPSCSSFDI